MRDTVLLLSGGVDSDHLLYKHIDEIGMCLHIDYGQRAAHMLRR